MTVKAHTLSLKEKRFNAICGGDNYIIKEQRSDKPYEVGDVLLLIKQTPIEITREDGKIEVTYEATDIIQIAKIRNIVTEKGLQDGYVLILLDLVKHIAGNGYR